MAPFSCPMKNAVLMTACVIISRKANLKLDDSASYSSFRVVEINESLIEINESMIEINELAWWGIIKL